MLRLPAGPLQTWLRTVTCRYAPQVARCVVEVYLLEQTRIIAPNDAERNYHVFYQVPCRYLRYLRYMRHNATSSTRCLAVTYVTYVTCVTHATTTSSTRCWWA